MKFSIIIPVYNTADFLKKCFESIIVQKKGDFSVEVIIINDGSPDNSDEIIKKYIKKYKNFIYINKKNGGLSEARNDGVKKATGDYILFVDSDDYLNKELLFKLEKKIKNNNLPDLIKFDSQDVNFKNEVLKTVVLERKENSIDLIKEAMDKKCLEVAWSYCYNLNFFKENNFKYEPNKIHEDYGLTPIILYNAKSISQLSYIGYNYLERNNSIMAITDYKKIKKNVKDSIFLYHKHKDFIKKDSIKGKLLLSYSLEAVLNKLTLLENNDMYKELEIIKKEINASDIYCYNKNKLLKKIILLINKKLYLKLYKKNKKIK